MIAHIDQVYRDQLMVDYAQFLAQVVELYGDGVVRASRVTWIHQIRLPGSIELVSADQLFRQLVESPRVFVSQGTGPWTAMREMVSMVDGLKSGDPAVVLSDTRLGRGPRYATKLRKGPLIELWPEVLQDPLFALMIRLTAEAWQVGVETLVGQDGWQHNQERVVGAFRRS
ncbi:Hypothetical protein I5071_88830 [Sandaracinus amylolyticus]|nr:Hypothetical protein I5071_88830 [Sandaracinus amylolyticus]